MIVRNLPPPAIFSANGRPLVFADHVLITGIISSPYTLPEHRPGMGLIAQLTGAGIYTVNGQRGTLRPGEFLLVNRDSRLALTLPHPGAQPLFLFFHTGLAAELAAAIGVDWRWLERVHPLPPKWRQNLDELISLGITCSSFGGLKADGLIRGMLDELFLRARCAEKLSTALPVTRPATRVDLFKRLDLAREWMIANHASPVTIDDMAGVAALHTQHFLRMFRACFGRTPHRFLTETRLEAARQRLLHSDENVIDICRHTGFESPTSFSGLFRKRFGRPPAAFRRSPPA